MRHSSEFQLVSAVRVFLVLLIAVTAAGAQTAAQAGESQGVNYGGYQVQQSIEFGGRVTSLSGSGAMYNTFTNLQSGPRLLEQSLSMRSQNHAGVLFDTLDIKSFGWGGDPENVLRMNASKDKWYEFDGSFRRHQYYFDYDLFSNPLNPDTSSPAIPVTSSPHSYYLRHRMYDYNLKLLPQRRVSLRLEYYRNRDEGPSFSSVHFGTDALLNQPWNTTVNQYRIGVDYRPFAHTNISFDQILKYYKGDTDYSLAQFATFPLSTGTPVELGLPWDTAGNSPCRTPLTGGVANPTCNGYLSYTRTPRVRTSIPTEQLTLQSRDIPNFEITGRGQYSSADMSNTYSEVFDGLESRTAGRLEQNAATGGAKWISVVAELGVTYRITDRLRLLETFRFNNWRMPGSVLLNELAFFNAGSGSLIQPVVMFPGTTPTHTSSSPADITVANYALFLGENDKTNEFRVEYDFTRRLGASIGYRYGRRFIHHADALAEDLTFYPSLPNRGACAGVALNTDGSCSVSTSDSGEDDFPINEHTGLLAVWAHPTDNLRLNFNMSLMSADNFITRISPTHQQQYRARASYAPNSKVNVGATVNILERRNPFELVNNFLGHVRDYGMNVMVAPNDRVSLNLAYNFSDFLEHQNVCFASAAPPAGSFTCLAGGGLQEALGNYNNQTNFGTVLVLFRPVNRVHASVGYNVTDTNGNTLTLNPLQPTGPLAYRYHQPMASLSVDLANRWAWNVGWNYDQYHEGGDVGPTAPRYFHDNRTTLSLRYAF